MRSFPYSLLRARFISGQARLSVGDFKLARSTFDLISASASNPITCGQTLGKHWLIIGRWPQVSMCIPSVV